MLVLTRKEGEKIIIGNDIVITVTRIEHSKVRIGIAAPDEIAVHRAELSKDGAIPPSLARTSHAKSSRHTG